jgi:hypothetical protein
MNGSPHQWPDTGRIKGANYLQPGDRRSGLKQAARNFFGDGGWGGPYATVATGIVTTGYTDTGLANGTVYFYVVSASTAVGESGDSSQVSATPVSMAPVNVSLSLPGGRLSLSWPGDHTGWRLEAQTNSLTSSNWFTVPASLSTNEILVPLDASVTNVFFRLAFP